MLQAHTETKELDQLRQLRLDGLEIYNLHANVDPELRRNHLNLDQTGFINGMLDFATSRKLPPDLAFVSFWAPNRPALRAFDTLLAEGRRLVDIAGTDAHQNVSEAEMNDGERLDSYRRMMRWFSNHLLVEQITPTALEEALRRGRAYVAFEIWGTPVGFDFHAEAGDRIAEMGGSIPLTEEPRIVLNKPAIHGLQGTIPMELRIFRAQKGGAVEVASGNEQLTFEPTRPGAYRAEIRLQPVHLDHLLNDDTRTFAERKFVWIYSNPVYVTDS